MAIGSRARPLAAAALISAVAIPVTGGDVFVAWYAVAALGRLAGAWP